MNGAGPSDGRFNNGFSNFNGQRTSDKQNVGMTSQVSNGSGGAQQRFG